MERLADEPAHRDDRNPGRFERLLGKEPARTYVPLLLRPWVMDCAHKEAALLGEKATLTFGRSEWLIVENGGLEDVVHAKRESAREVLSDGLWFPYHYLVVRDRWYPLFYGDQRQRACLSHCRFIQ